MEARFLALADQLRLIENELRQLGWWTSMAPAAERLASVEPFCADTLAFEEWLQWIFLPRMTQIIEQQAALPASCAIQPLGEMLWAGEGERLAVLLGLLGEFDRLIATAA